MKDERDATAKAAPPSSFILHPSSLQYPARLRQRLGSAAPPELTALGNPALLSQPMTALFCSARCPGGIILSAYDQAAHWRDTGRCVISGFHSSVEKECLRILLRGSQPVIICPARSIPTRPPPEWRAPMSEGRLLLLSFFKDGPRRPTTETAQRRNTLVAALADDVYIPYASPGGHLQPLLQVIKLWAIPVIPPPPPREPVTPRQ